MAVPNRYADIDAICAANPQAFAPGPEHDNTRRELLIGTIIPTLNADHPEDRDGWGYMTKTDQPQGDGTYKIPCDVIMWRKTNESVDCLTSSGAMWNVHDEPAPPEWIWTAAESGTVPEGGTDLSGDAPPYDDERAVAFGLACNDAITEAEVTPDGGMVSVHSQRCAYDYYVKGMDWPACYDKHVNAFRAEYGLPPVEE
jgi:hypothetical protein